MLRATSIAHWLHETALRLYPDSDYAKRERHERYAANTFSAAGSLRKSGAFNGAPQLLDNPGSVSVHSSLLAQESPVEPAVLVLIAEDQIDLRDILQASFEDGGFAVVLAASGEEAIAGLEAKGKAVRALITDINLGSTATGWDVARHGREMNPDLPVVYVTGAEGHDWASLGVPNSVLIAKPFAPAQVLTAVSQLLNVGSTPGA